MPGHVLQDRHVRVHVDVEHDRAIDVAGHQAAIREVGDTQFVIAVAVSQAQLAVQIDGQRPCCMDIGQKPNCHVSGDTAVAVQVTERDLTGVRDIERRCVIHEINTERHLHMDRGSLCVEAARQTPVDVVVEVAEAGLTRDVEPRWLSIERAVVSHPQQIAARIDRRAEIVEMEAQRLQSSPSRFKLSLRR